ncbi:MAG TPA: flagellar export chaperone FliS [Terriglobales bacterium]|jgi:flagellar protein FliS
MDPRIAYREQSAQGASKVAIVIALYDQAAHDLSQAILAVQKGDIEGRSREIDHALAVIGHLQGRLDHKQGGEIARNLDRFYDLVRKRLLEAQFASSAEILREQRELLLSLRSAWVEVEQAELRNKMAPQPKAPSAPKQAPSSEDSSSDWKV